MTDITNTAGNDSKNYAYNILKERLINCTYAPGSILNRAHLTSEMKLNHTPVREAASHLETEEFVKVVPKKGIHVTNILLSDMLQIFQIRTESEPTIPRLSASRLPKNKPLYFIQCFENPDPDDTVMDRIRLSAAMHLFIVGHCGNRYMVGIMHRVYDISSRTIFFIRQDHTTVRDDSGKNLEIPRFLLDRDLETATRKARVHVEHCRITALNYLYTVPGEGAPAKTYRDRLYRKQETAPHPYR